MFHKMLNLTLVRIQLPDEAVADFHYRLNKKTQTLSHLFGRPTVESIVVHLQTGWVGHVARQSPFSPVCAARAWRDQGWWREVADNPSRPRYLRRGAQVGQSTDALFAHLGPFWKELTEDRLAWKRASYALQKSLGAVDDGELEVSRALRPFSLVPTISNKLRDFIGGLPPTHGWRAHAVFVTNCEAVLRKVTGQMALTGRDTYLGQAIERLRWLFYLIGFRLPLLPAFPQEGFLVYRARLADIFPRQVAESILADSAAEYAWLNPDFSSLSEVMNLRIHCCGVCSSPQLSSCAAVAYLDFFDGVVSQSCIVAVRGRLIRVPDASCAEAEALLLSTELLVEVLKMCKYL